MMESIAKELSSAIELRKSIQAFQDSGAIRLFNGPGESAHAELRELAIDLFRQGERDHFWLTQWKRLSPATLDSVCDFLSRSILDREFKASLGSIVLMDRSGIASESEAKSIYGVPPSGRFSVLEWGVPYRIQLENTKHPGLFLDHAELRRWLLRTQKNKTVLNLFSYTGSLSVASGAGGASRVTTLDLSKSTIEWAKENWANAGLSTDAGDFIYGDVFEWLPKFKKKDLLFDTILCDPPSFSRSKNGTFSTQKDTQRLHESILPLIRPGGILITSINSENVTERQFLKDIEAAAERCKCSLRVLSRIDLPPTFPTGMDLKERYLKGFFLVKH